YGYIKNHKKTVKNGQARTLERKSVQKPEAKPEKVKPLGKREGKWKLMAKMDNSSGRIHGGKVKSVNPRQFISSLKLGSHRDMEKA
ncbi:hypothetical protein Tco_1489724, partial [Tanacetum coccineum]